MNDALLSIATVAHSLKETEVRVLLEIAARCARQGTTDTRASLTDLAKAANVGRANTARAIAELNRRGLVTSDKGSPTAAASHRPNLTQVVRPEPSVGGAKLAPPVVPNQNHPGAELAPPLVLNWHHPGADLAPPPAPHKETQARAPAFGSFDIDFRLEASIERLQRAKPSDYDADMLSRIRDRIHGYKVKYLADDATPPDALICAQLLSLAELPRIEAMLYDLMAERRKPGSSDGWWITVALQRICGVSPAALKAKREEIAARRPPQPQQLHRAIAAAAAGKAMR